MRKKTALAVLAGVVLVSACADPYPYQTSPDYVGHGRELKKIGMVVDVNVYAVSVFEINKDADQSAEGQKNFEAAFTREFTANGYEVTLLPREGDVRFLLSQYVAVRGDIRRPFLGTKGLITALPPLQGTGTIAAKAGLDGVVIVNQIGHVPTFGKKVFNALLGGQNGPGPSAYPQFDTDFAMLDKSGKVLFYGPDIVGGTDERAASSVASACVSHLVEAGQEPKKPE